MLKLKTYSISEIADELKMQANRQGIKRKLDRKGIQYSVSGRGVATTFTIINIPSPFALFCITELSFDPKCDFQRVRNLFYYCFNDEEFFTMPNEFKEEKLREEGFDISRQTIAKYLDKICAANYFAKSANDFRYYFALGNVRKYTTKEQYLAAWHDYWSWKDEIDFVYASQMVKQKYNGFPRKQALLEENAFEQENIQTLINLTNQSFDQEFGNF